MGWDTEVKSTRKTTASASRMLAKISRATASFTAHREVLARVKSLKKFQTRAMAAVTSSPISALPQSDRARSFKNVGNATPEPGDTAEVVFARGNRFLVVRILLAILLPGAAGLKEHGLADGQASSTGQFAAAEPRNHGIR